MKRHEAMVALAVILALGLFPVAPAGASSLIFEGNNAALFPGANPSNNSLMLLSTNKPKDPNSSLSLGQLTPEQLIEQSVEAQVAAQINTEIFDKGNPSGTFNLGNGSIISFIRSGGNIEITIIDPVHGTTTITIPDL